MLFKRNGNKEVKGSRDKEYFKKYIKTLEYGEFLELIQAMFEVSRETGQIMVGRNILKDNDTDDKNDPSIG